MKQLIILYLLFLQSLITFSQTDHSDNNSPFKFKNKVIDENNLNEIIADLPFLLYNLRVPELDSLVDCLLQIDSTNTKLKCFKTFISFNNNDTMLINKYDYCIESGFLLKEAYYNKGAIYYNKYFESIKGYPDTVSPKAEKIKLLDKAEKNMWLSVKSGNNHAYFEIGEIQKLKRLSSVSFPKLRPFEIRLYKPLRARVEK